LLDPVAMQPARIPRSPEQVVESALELHGYIECEQILVGDVLVLRDGNHYRIVGDPDRWDDAPSPLDSAAGRACGCGAPLSSRDHHWVCRSCGQDRVRR
jgi:hypothetical protein